MLGKDSAAEGVPTAATDASGLDDARLLAGVERGDLRAFEELYRRYHVRLTRFLKTTLGPRSLVEEVLDDTMMVVWTNAGRYNGASRVSTWIFGIAYRKALKAHSRYDAPVEDAEAKTRASAEPGPEHELGRRQVQRLLRKAMSELSHEHRTVVDLSYFHEIGYREIAEIMDCPVDTVKTRMFHARRHLKAKLAGELGDWL